MQLSVYAGSAGAGVGHIALLQQTEIVRDSTDAVGTATVVFRNDFDSIARFDSAHYDVDRYAFEPLEWDVLELRDQSGTKQFAGLITNIQKQSPDGMPGTQIACSATDYGILFDRVVLNSTYPAGWSDKDIIIDALTGNPYITINGALIEETTSDLSDFDAQDITARELLERICELTGAEWRVDYLKRLRYYIAGSEAAPFGVSDEPNNTTTFAHYMDEVRKDSAQMANRVTVIGGYDEDGNEISAIAQDAESQGKYGLLSATLVDRGITTQAAADLKAAAELSQRAFPIIAGKFTCWRDGLDIGQTISIRNREYNISGNYLIRAINIKQVATSPGMTDVAGQVYCIYEVEFGQKIPDLVSQLRRMERKPRQPAYEPIARPANNSITVTNFASSIEPIIIVNALPVLPDANYSQNAVVLYTVDRKLYRRSGNSWTRHINSADLIDQIQAGQLAADSVTAGTIAAGAIRAVDAVFEAAAIQNADINTVSANKLTAGTIDANVISVINLNATNITTGTMSGVRLADGTVADIKIASGLSASKLTTGTLDANLVNVTNLNASNITVGQMSGIRLQDGTVADVKITGLAASKISAGTISASVTLTSPTLVITSGSFTVNVDGTNLVRVTNTAANRRSYLGGSAIQIEDTGSPGSVFGALTTTGLTIVNASQRVDIGTTSMGFGGLQVITTQQPAISMSTVFANSTYGVNEQGILNGLQNIVQTILTRLRTHGLIAS